MQLSEFNPLLNPIEHPHQQAGGHDGFGCFGNVIERHLAVA
jgi:hypothetical protein